MLVYIMKSSLLFLYKKFYIIFHCEHINDYIWKYIRLGKYMNLSIHILNGTGFIFQESVHGQTCDFFGSDQSTQQPCGHE